MNFSKYSLINIKKKHYFQLKQEEYKIQENNKLAKPNVTKKYGKQLLFWLITKEAMHLSK